MVQRVLSVLTHIIRRYVVIWHINRRLLVNQLALKLIDSTSGKVVILIERNGGVRLAFEEGKGTVVLTKTRIGILFYV